MSLTGTSPELELASRALLAARVEMDAIREALAVAEEYESRCYTAYRIALDLIPRR